MCLSPIFITNPTHYLAVDGHEQYKTSVPCGKCAECRQHKHDEWYLRAFFQSKYCLSHGGYVYFDTLTYKDTPMLSDFFSEIQQGSVRDYPCFSKRDIQNFLKRLRKRIDKVIPDYRFTYFLTSEYGSVEHTERPHYHVLFYIPDHRLDPIVLSRLVHDCWNLGRTDGIVEYGASRVIEHTFGYYSNKSLSDCQGICGYVSKYVLKDAKFDKMVRFRISSLMPEFFESSKLEKKRFEQMVRTVSPFHLESQGFGLCALAEQDVDSILENGTIRMTDRENVVKSIPLPTYFKRHLFQEQVEMPDGSKCWQYTELGIRYKVLRQKKAMDYLVRRLEEWTFNLNDSVKSTDKKYGWYDDNRKEWQVRTFEPEEIEVIMSKIRSDVSTYLDGRSLRDFAEYILRYRGRVKDSAHLERIFSDGVLFVEPFSDTPLRLSDKIKHTRLYYNYATTKDRRQHGCNLISDTPIKDGLRLSPDRMDGIMRSSDFCKTYIITQDDDPRFRHFDDLYDTYVFSNQWFNRRKQVIYDRKDELKKIFEKVLQK